MTQENSPPRNLPHLPPKPNTLGMAVGELLDVLRPSLVFAPPANDRTFLPGTNDLGLGTRPAGNPPTTANPSRYWGRTGAAADWAALLAVMRPTNAGARADLGQKSTRDDRSHFRAAERLGIAELAARLQRAALGRRQSSNHAPEHRAARAETQLLQKLEQALDRLIRSLEENQLVLVGES